MFWFFVYNGCVYVFKMTGSVIKRTEFCCCRRGKGVFMLARSGLHLMGPNYVSVQLN